MKITRRTMGKPKNGATENTAGKQSKISTFFQAKGGETRAVSNTSRLFSSVNENTNKSKLSLKKNNDEGTLEKKDEGPGTFSHNTSLFGKVVTHQGAQNYGHRHPKNVLHDSSFEDNKIQPHEEGGTEDNSSAKEGELILNQQKIKQTLTQASTIIRSITGVGLEDENKIKIDDNITCIPETQMDTDVLSPTPKSKIQVAECLTSPQLFSTQNDPADPSIIPDTPQTKIKPAKKKSLRSFLSSSSTLTRTDPLHKKMTEKAQIGKHNIKPLKTIAAKKPVGRTLEEAMKCSNEDLEFASPATMSVITTGLSFGREAFNPQREQGDKSEFSLNKKKSPGGVVGSLSGVKRSPVSGSSPNPKRTLRKTPTKHSVVSKPNIKKRKFTKNLSDTYSRNIFLKGESKCPQDSREKDVHLDADDDLASVLMDLKEEIASPVVKKEPERRPSVFKEKEDNDQKMEVDFHVPSHDEPDEALDDLISELRQNLTQSQTKTQSFKKRTDKSILSEGLTPRVVKSAKRQIKPDKTIETPAKVNRESVPHVRHEEHSAVGEEKTSFSEELENSTGGLDQLDLEVEEELKKQFEALTPSKDHYNSVYFQLDKFKPHSLHYGRCKVKEVVNEGQNVLLSLLTDPGEEPRQALLSGFWADLHLEAGDLVHIIGEFDKKGRIDITDGENFIIVHPDHLISGTSVVSGLYCMRRAVLNERFKGYENKNIHMLHGTIIHTFFQQVVQGRQLDDGALNKLARSILEEHRVLHDMYGQGTDRESVLTEIIKIIPQLRKWVDKYLPPPVYSFGDKKREPEALQITKIADIEENVWSPRYGIKGKIDLTVEVKIHDRQKGMKKKLLPLELKTGRPTHSVEHKGQVTLYSMMSSDRREDPESGLLLYLKDGSMTTVPAGHPNKRGLVQLRNELAHHIKKTIKTKEGSGLPRPINNLRACSKCPQLLNCVAYKRVFNEGELDPKHAMSSLEPETLAHLQLQHMDYYKHWIQLMMAELATGNKRRGQLKDLWCKTGWEREQEGQCFSGMLHHPSTDGSEAAMTETGLYIQTFERIDFHPSKIPLRDIGINVGDNLVVSAENEPMIALSMGAVTSINTYTVTLHLDRDLHKTDKEGKLIYRLDKADTYNSMATNMSNLTRLMEDTESSAHLRDIVIEKKTPEFEPTLSRDALNSVKGLFKGLNKPQKTAVLKVLMCKDYVLIKGYPGTGKTSTIVSLVQILVKLGRSVLLTSYTHSAVDNILLKLAKNNIGFIRLGRSERIHPDLRSYSAELNTLKMTEVEDLAKYYNSSLVVATTCLGVGSHPIFTHRRFDICIVDEASQVLQPACLGPLFVSRKFVLVGDPLQLPPVVESREAREKGMAESLFARLDDTGATYELNLQYRMNSEIMRLSNELVYNGALKCGNDKVADGQLSTTSDDTSPGWIQTVLCSDKRVLFLDMDKVEESAREDRETDVQNVCEAKVVTHLVHAFVTQGVPKDEVGVITPYRQQVSLLRKQLEDIDVEVNTVDQYQGRDKCCIIVSFVKRTPGKGSGILEDIRRLNVALTRSRHKLILVGSVSTLTTYGPLKAVLDILTPQQIYQLPPNLDHCD